MKVTVIGSHLCPDTIWAVNKLYEAGVEVTYKDILSCHADLREYLALRDSHEVYADIRGTDRLGVPCFLCEDGRITLDIHDILK